jgi:hypothetical protein
MAANREDSKSTSQKPFKTLVWALILSAVALAFVLAPVSAAKVSHFKRGWSHAPREFTRYRDNVAPSRPGPLVTLAATTTTLRVKWSPSWDRSGVAGYDVFVNGARAGTTWWWTYTIDGLTCGRSYSVSVVAFDRAGNRSLASNATMATGACGDSSPPAVPTGFRQEFTTASSVVVSWQPSSDDGGVVEYGIFAGGFKVASTAEPRYTFTRLACDK